MMYSYQQQMGGYTFESEKNRTKGIYGASRPPICTEPRATLGLYLKCLEQYPKECPEKSSATSGICVYINNFLGI